MSDPNGNSHGIGPTRRRALQASAVAPAALGTGDAQSVQTCAQPAQAGAAATVAVHIIRRLGEHNVRHLFGVPGVTCDGAFVAAHGAGFASVINASDLEAGYAADGYARMRGMGAVAVTYGVGTMSLLPVIAGAYAERVPIVLLNGGPNTTDLIGNDG